MSKHPTLNQTLADRIERIATTAINRIAECRTQGDDVTTSQGLAQKLLAQEGVFSRRATYLGPQSEDRYKKGPAIHDASGKFRRSDAKG